MRYLLLSLFWCVTVAAQPFTPTDIALIAKSSRLLDKLVGYWKLEETQLIQRFDSVGTNHLSVSSSFALPTNGPGKVFLGNYFNPALVQSMYCNTSQAISVGTNTPITISLWFKPTTVGSCVLIEKNTNNSGNNTEFMIGVSASAKPYFRVSDGTASNPAIMAASITTNTWYNIVGWYDDSTKSNYCQVNGGAITSVPWTNGTHYTGGQLHVGGSAVNASFCDGILDEVAIWKRVLTASERAQLLRGVSYPNFYPLSTRVISSPQPFQVFQRQGTNGNILISGSVGEDGTHTIEARFNGGAWQTIQSNATSTFSGYLTNQPQGSGSVEVRYADLTNIVFPINPVGIGDVFLVSGQSNASGHGQNLQTATNNSQFVSMFSNAYKWRTLRDPLDDNALQIDYVSSDVTSPGQTWGSPWPIIAAQVVNNQNVPVAMIPCPLGGTDLGQWQPGAVRTNRLSLYGSMIWRGIAACPGIPPKTILWWQGENDAWGGTNQATYFQALTNLAAAVKSDLGCNLMPCKLQTITGNTNVTTINAAIAQAIAVSTNITAGPDLNGITADTGSHITTNAGLLSVATNWWSTLQTAFY